MGQPTDFWQVELPGIGIVDLRPQSDLRQQQTPLNWSQPAPSKMRARDIPAAAAKQVYNQLLEPAAETSLMFGSSIAGEVAAIPGIVGQAMDPEKYAERGYQTAGEVRDAVVDKVAYKPQGEATHAGLEVVNGVVTFMGEQLLPLREGYENTMNPLIGEKAAGALYAGAGALAFVAPGAVITAPGRAANRLGQAAGRASQNRWLAKEAEGMAKGARANNTLVEPPRLTGPAARDVPTPKPMTGQVDQQMTNALRRPLSDKFPSQRGGPAWHGTPHSRLDKIPKGGKTDNILDIFHPANAYSGEGNQSFGYTPVGYFAEQAGVAKGYANTLSNDKAVIESLNKIVKDDDVAEAISDYASMNGDDIYGAMDDYREVYGDHPALSKLWDAVEDGYKLPSRGTLMEVDFDDAAVSRMLDWDAPLSEQPESVRAALNLKVYKDPDAGRSDQWVVSALDRVVDGYPTKKAALDALNTKTGQDIHRGLALGDDNPVISAALNEAGIPGIRYYDGSSRTARSVDKAHVKAAQSFADAGSSLDEAVSGMQKAYPNAKLVELRVALQDAGYKNADLGTRNIVPFDPDIINWVKRDGETIFEKPSNNEMRGPGFRQRGSIDNTKTKGLKKTAAKVAVTNAMRKKANVVESSRPQPTVKNALAGLMPSPEAAAARLGRKIKRQNLPAEKRPGQRVNKRKVLKAKGQPDFVVGELTFDDWIKRTESLLTKGEIKKARLWYKEIHDTFKPFFGKATDQVVAAFLIANKNVSPAGALANALRAREQLLTGVGDKKAGLNHDALMKLFKGESIEKGVGQKLYDFVDSQAGKPTRSFYGDDPLAGEPTVVDVHTARDAGYVDVPLLNVLKDKGYNVSGVKPDFKYDAAKKTSGAPSETQYENAGDWLRELTGDLNTRGYAGGNWTGSETQAVGWVALSKFTGAKAEDSLATISKNISRVSFELAPGRGSPAAAKYGEQFSELSVAKQKQVTKKTLKGVSSWVADNIGIASFDMVAGTGGWMKFTNPALVTQMLASKQTVELATNIIGYLAQQEQVWANRLKPMTANPKGFGVSVVGKDMRKDSVVKKVWDHVLENDTSGLMQGYQPIVNEDGVPGILILVDKGGKKTMSAIENEIRIMFDDIANSMENDIITKASEAEIYKAGIEGAYDGKEYLERIRQAGREDLIPALRDYRGKLEKKFGAELEKFKSKTNALLGDGQ